MARPLDCGFGIADCGLRIVKCGVRTPRLVVGMGFWYNFGVSFPQYSTGRKVMLLKIVGAVIGLVAAVVTITLSQAAMSLVVEPPSAEMMNDPDTMRAFVAGLPATAYLILAIGYAIGSFIGGFVAGKISGGSAAGFFPAMFVGGVLTFFGVVNFFVTMPGSPLWAIILCLATYLPFAALGNKMSGGKSTA